MFLAEFPSKSMSWSSNSLKVTISMRYELTQAFHSNLEPFNFYLQDRGSSKDTFEKVSYFIPKRLQADQELLLGADVYVSILEVKDTFNVEGQASYSDESLFSHSLRKLLKEEVEIVGTGNEHLYYLQSSVDDIDEAQYPQLKFVKWDSYFNFEIPYVKLEITYKNAPLTAKPQKVLFFPHVQDTFTFGRSYEVDIPVMSSTCSRRQARYYIYFSFYWLNNYLKDFMGACQWRAMLGRLWWRAW